MIVKKLFALAGLASSCLLVLSIAVLAHGVAPAGPCGFDTSLIRDQHQVARR